jgi:hypothetical protein
MQATKIKIKYISNGQRYTTQKTKDRATRTPLKTGDEISASTMVSSSCSTMCTRRGTLVTNPVISHEWGHHQKVNRNHTSVHFVSVWNASVELFTLMLNLWNAVCVRIICVTNYHVYVPLSGGVLIHDLSLGKWTEVWFLFFIMIITFWVNWNFLLVRQFCSSKNIIFHVSQFFFIYLSTKRESKHNDSLWKVSNILFWFSIILKESCFQTMFCFLCRTTWLSVWSELQYKRI